MMNKDFAFVSHLHDVHSLTAAKIQQQQQHYFSNAAVNSTFVCLFVCWSLCTDRE